MRSARATSPSNIYRVAIRAAQGRDLFVENEERSRFLEMVRSSFEGRVEILAWCLTAQCVQMVLWADMATLSQSLQNILSRYARYCNKRRNTAGNLYLDRFFSEPIESDGHLLAAICVVHRYPCDVGETATLKYGWSSYREYFGARELCNTVPALGAAGGRSALRKLHKSASSAPVASLPRARKRLSDDEAAVLAAREFGPNPQASIGRMSLDARNEKVRALKAEGLSARQISRFTGLGRGVVERA